jgi:protein involved in polysaccharide export with SLBB domain
MVRGDLVRRGGGGSLRRIRRLIACCLAVVGLCVAAYAQVNGSSSEQLQQLQQLQQLRNAGGTAVGQPSVTPRETILEPAASSMPKVQSDVERILSSRAGMRLQMYGYDQLGVSRSVSLPQVGAVQDDYVLGVGDEVVLTLRGQENSEYRVQVDRDGNVTYPRLNPVSAAGRTLGKFRQDLVGAIHRAYVSTEGFVTIGRIRQISVLVGGEVGNPGVRTLTGLSTVVDALSISGGIKKTGSLRNVQIVRGNRTFSVDLYSILVGGVVSKYGALTDGDKIIVPPLGKAVAVAGSVRRSGIYELPPNTRSITVNEAMRLANGPTMPGVYTISLLQTQPNGTRRFVDVTAARSAQVEDGEVILVRAAVDVSVNQVQLTGAVRTPGALALGKYATLHDVLPSMDVLRPGAYVLLGVIDRTDPVTLQRLALPFSPLHVVQGKENLGLVSNDRVRILSRADVRKIRAATFAKNSMFKQDFDQSASTESQQVPKDDANRDENSSGPQRPRQRDDGRSVRNGDVNIPAGDRDDLASSTDATSMRDTSERGDATGEADTTDRYGTTGTAAKLYRRRDTVIGTPVYRQSRGAEDRDLSGESPDETAPLDEFMSRTDRSNALNSDDYAFFGKALANNWVYVSGAVRDSGFYLAGAQTVMAEILDTVGGLVDDVDTSEFELTSTVIDNATGESTTTRTTYPATQEQFAKIVLKPFDRVHFRQVYSDKFSGSVKVDGEVRYPGVYSILRNEKLSSVLQRAGGMTDVAFPDGAVFLRNSVAKAEQEESRRVLGDMRNQLLAVMIKPSTPTAQPPSADTIKALETLMTKLEKTEALGRVPVVANPSILQNHPDLDMVLEPGDSITVPKKPATVLVTGEVMRSGAQRFEPSNSVDDYIEQAGGTTRMADTSRIIVVLPDGSVRSDSDSWLSFGFGSRIPVGSTIFVPRELDPYTVHQFVVDTVQIFAQLATSAAALAVLSKQ